MSKDIHNVSMTTANQDYVLELSSICRSFPEGGGRLDVLRGCNLTISASERVALVGPSGSGKSTLLHIAGLLERPDSGSIRIGGREAGAMDDGERTLLRRHSIGFVYQSHHLLDEFSARENIMLPQMLAGIARRQAGERADELLALVGLSERASHRPATMSGGEQQRVAMARALANRPAVLIADEPTGNLDPHTAEVVFAVLEGLAASQGLGMLMATHNLDLAARMDRSVELRDCKLLQLAK